MREKIHYCFMGKDHRALIREFNAHEIAFHDLGPNPVRPFFLKKKEIPDLIKYLEQFVPEQQYMANGSFIALDTSGNMLRYPNSAIPDQFRGRRFQLVVISGHAPKELVRVLEGCCVGQDKLVIDKDAVVF